MNTPNMYADAKTWNPFKGCRFDCIYCRPSFQALAKRQKQSCNKCYAYQPHYHPERLRKIPSASTVFVCGSADIAFCIISFVRKIIAAIKKHNIRCPHKTYYFQSKQPECFLPFLEELPSNAIVLTTLETNRDEGYDAISKAPPPSERFRQFRDLPYARKVVTIEPLLDFDLPVFVRWIRSIKPEYIWLGFNSRPRSLTLPEPSITKAQKLVDQLVAAGISIRPKTMRGVKLPK